jgi:deazaflavin-dependent oxidoreductase (nitroreductase family)
MPSLKDTQKQSSRRINWPSTFLAALLAALITIIVLIRGKYIRYNQREINKRYINPLMLKFAGRQYSPQAIIYHEGRKSGRSYSTPVVIEPITDGFIIPLPYGTDVDWCRNILAAGQCTIQWHGNSYTVTEPALINAADVITELSPMRQRIFHMIGVKQVLKVHISAVTPVNVSRREATSVL